MRTARAVIIILVPLVASALTQSSSPALKADKVMVYKKQRLLVLFNKGKEVKRYNIALGGEPVGPKAREGDHKTPEGPYTLDRRNANSRFYKSIHISYPTRQQRVAAKRAGASAGGEIYVHGLGKQYGWVGAAHRLRDWTDGCIAVTNEEMDEIWAAVADGTPIEIKP